MGNWERNLIIFGASGVLALGGVLFSGNLVLGMIWTFIVLAVALFIAMGRFGPDRATLEEWLRRRWQYSRSTKRYTFAQPISAQVQEPARPAPRPEPKPLPRTPPPALPVTLDTDDVGAYYGAITVMLLVGGIVFITWLHGGGDIALARSFEFLWR